MGHARQQCEITETRFGSLFNCELRKNAGVDLDVRAGRFELRRSTLFTHRANVEILKRRERALIA